MIKTPTTFVIGAGASKPYGLPTGPELHQKARELNQKSDFYQLIRARTQMPEELEEFRLDLSTHTAKSIDAYLQTRQKEEKTMKIGRCVLAALMAGAVQKKRDAEIDEDWLDYIFDKMAEGCDSGEAFDQNNNVTFVTFNFDTIVETHFRRYLTYTYRNGGTVPEVIHVHGMLPTPPNEPIRHEMRERPGWYSDFHPRWLEWLDGAASSINVVLDEINETTLERARKAVRNARILCFLGFAYATPNLKRLGVDNLVTGGAMNPAPKMIYGSAYDLKDGERESVRVFKFRQQIELGDEKDGCRDVLRKFPIFRE